MKGVFVEVLHGPDGIYCVGVTADKLTPRTMVLHCLPEDVDVDVVPRNKSIDAGKIEVVRCESETELLISLRKLLNFAKGIDTPLFIGQQRDLSALRAAYVNKAIQLPKLLVVDLAPGLNSTVSVVSLQEWLGVYLTNSGGQPGELSLGELFLVSKNDCFAALGISLEFVYEGSDFDLYGSSCNLGSVFDYRHCYPALVSQCVLNLKAMEIALRICAGECSDQELANLKRDNKKTSNYANTRRPRDFFPTP